MIDRLTSWPLAKVVVAKRVADLQHRLLSAGREPLNKEETATSVAAQSIASQGKYSRCDTRLRRRQWFWCDLSSSDPLEFGLG